MIYAHKDGVYRDFGDIQWNYMPNKQDGTKDGWTQVSKEQYDIATDPAKKNFVPPEVKLVAPEPKQSQTVSPAGVSDAEREIIEKSMRGEFGDVNATGATSPEGRTKPTRKELVELLLEKPAPWGEIYSEYVKEFGKDYNSWQALKGAYDKQTLPE